MYNCVLYFWIYLHGLNLNGWHAVFCITNNRQDVTITTHAIKRHFLIWMTMVRQPAKRRCSCVLTLKYTLIWVYWWTRQKIHNTLIVVDWYLRLMGDKTIPDSVELRLESFYPPFAAGIDLPHQGVGDFYSPSHLFHHVPIVISSWNFQELLPWTEVMSMQGQGQRSKVKVTEVNTQLSIEKVFFRVICQISRSHGAKNRRFWPEFSVSAL